MTEAAYSIYDAPANSEDFVEPLADGYSRARLLIGGVHCAACTWLIETALLREGAVRSADVNLSRQSLLVEWKRPTLPLSRLFALIQELGYEPEPWQAHPNAERVQREQRLALGQLAVAGLAMMQVGMFGIALHAGDLQGMAGEYRTLLRGVSLLVATVVVFFSAAGFFRNAWSNLRHGRLVMDLPVALAIGLAYAASAYATATGTGQVYFDSIAMFTFFLLLGRYLERRVRVRELLRQTDLNSLLPPSAQRRIGGGGGGGWEHIPTRSIVPGDVLMVPGGTVVPADGEVVEGVGSVNEAAFSGEELPRAVQARDSVTAGTLLATGSLVIRASADTAHTRLADMMRVVARAEHAKPAIAALADRIAGWFVGGVLLVSAAVGLWWWNADPDRALWVGLAVLVVSCPCALALATPAALTSAVASLRRRGLLAAGENTLERISRCDQILFDKTGTLTTGQFTVSRIIDDTGTVNESRVRALAAALERHSRHPVATAFPPPEQPLLAENIEETPGSGLCGAIEGELYAIGCAAYIGRFTNATCAPPEPEGHWIALANADGPLAWFELEDSLRPEAREVVDALRRRGHALAILSGDRPSQVARAARHLGIDEFQAGCTPDEKLAYIQEQQSRGQRVAVVGDGLNDAPVLAAADCSFAVNEATDLAKSRADAILLKPDLRLLVAGVDTGRRTRAVIMQNMAWALGYNGLALPLAAAGMVPPWAAAIGMSLSSLLVVGNSLRLNRQHG